MKTIRVRITAEELEAKRIAEILERAFEEDGNPVTIYEASPDGRTWSAEILLFDMEPEEAAATVRDRVGADAFAAPLEAEELPDINWVEKSLEGLKPVRAGRFIVHGGHDRDKVVPGAIGLEIEAALAFGTGHHGTTAGCLEEIDRLLSLREYDSILDLGTGTGVLAIAAALKAVRACWPPTSIRSRRKRRWRTPGSTGHRIWSGASPPMAWKTGASASTAHSTLLLPTFWHGR